MPLFSLCGFFEYGHVIDLHTFKWIQNVLISLIITSLQPKMKGLSVPGHRQLQPDLGLKCYAYGAAGSHWLTTLDGKGGGLRWV